MKKMIFFYSFILFLYNCNEKKNDYVAKKIKINDLEIRIRRVEDQRAVFYFSDYKRLLQAINNKNCVVLPLYQLNEYIDSTKIIVGLRHDIDCHPYKALQIAKMESSFGYKATYYVLPTAKYYGFFDKDSNFYHNLSLNRLYQQIHDLGHEIGMHNDFLTIMIKWHKNPKFFNTYEIMYFKMLGIDFYGTASHGSSIAVTTKTPNYEIFKDFAKTDSIEYEGKKYPIGIDSLKNFGYQYEAYSLNYNKYLSDAGGKWKFEIHIPVNTQRKQNINQNLTIEKVISVINNAKPGDRIVILTHPVWWGKKSK